MSAPGASGRALRAFLTFEVGGVRGDDVGFDVGSK